MNNTVSKYTFDSSTIFIGDCRNVLRTFPNNLVNCCITSPPYYRLRNYGVDEQIGLEQTPEEYVDELVKVFREVKRVLKDDGTLWLNLGDSYSGSGKGQYKNGEHDPKKKKTDGMKLQSGIIYDGLKPKDLIGIPWRVAFALQSDGWYLRQDIIWAKNNPMPESVKDRCTKSHEYIFLLSKSNKYFYDNEAIKEPAKTKTTIRNKYAEGYQADYVNGNRFSEGERVYGADGKRNKRDVWFINTKPYKGAHFATFPVELIEPCVLAGCPENGIILDPFAGSGTVGEVCKSFNRNSILIELNNDYLSLIEKRIVN